MIFFFEELFIPPRLASTPFAFAFVAAHILLHAQVEAMITTEFWTHQMTLVLCPSVRRDDGKAGRENFSDFRVRGRPRGLIGKSLSRVGPTPFAGSHLFCFV